MKRIKYSDGTYEIIDDDFDSDDVNYDRVCHHASYKGKSVEYIMEDDYQEDYE